jgi:hypothetical protein
LGFLRAAAWTAVPLRQLSTVGPNSSISWAENNQGRKSVDKEKRGSAKLDFCICKFLEIYKNAKVNFYKYVDI